MEFDAAITLSMSHAEFTAEGVMLRINGQSCSLGGKPGLIREGLCVVLGDPSVSRELNTSLHPFNPEVKGCDHWSLVELAARHARWSNDETNAPWDDVSQSIIQDETIAREQWRGHVAALFEA